MSSTSSRWRTQTQSWKRREASRSCVKLSSVSFHAQQDASGGRRREDAGSRSRCSACHPQSRSHAARQAETKAECEAVAALHLKEEKERHDEQMRSQESRLNDRWQNRLDDMIEQKRRETVRAEKLKQERDTARADAQAQRRYAERVMKDKEEALRELQSKSLREKNAAIQMERDKAETARRTAMQAEAVRAAQVNLRSNEATEIMQLAAQSIKVAEEEKKRAEESIKKTEAERARLEILIAETEYAREEARLDVLSAKKAKEAAAERIAKMSDAMSLQNAALEAVKKSASAEKLALMKAAEESKAAALAAVAEEREAERKEAEATRRRRKQPRRWPRSLSLKQGVRSGR